MLKQLILKVGLFLFCLLPFPAFAQSIEGIAVFGDSLSSTAYLRKPGGFIPSSPPYFDGRFSNGSVWVEGFSTKFKLPAERFNNFAVGGSTSRRGNANLPGLRLQITDFLKASPTISSNELIVLWSGSNDYPGSTPATVVGNISRGINRLIDAGANQFIVPNLPDFPDFPAQRQAGSATLVKNPEFTNSVAAHNIELSASLQALAQANPNLSIIPTDMARLHDAVITNPERFGFDNVNKPCLDAITGVVCDTPDTYFFWDESPHPTAAAHRLLSAYALDTLTASGSIAAQTETALSSANQQIQPLNSHLLALRNGSALPARQISVFATGDANFGNRSTTSTNAGFNLDTKGVTVGADYPVNNNIALGVAFSAANTNNQLNDHRGKIAVDSTSVSVYGSYVQNRFYSDALVNYGWNKFKIARNIQVPGFTAASANPSGNQLSFRVNGGYELGSKGLFFGPIAGIRYTNVNIGGYTEQNGDLLNLKVNPQATNSLIVNFGAQVSYPFRAGFGTLSPYAAANFEHELIKNDRKIVTELVTQPGIPIRSKISATDRDFIRLSTGLQTEFTNNLSVTLGYETVLGKDNFSDNYLNAKIRYQF